MCQYALLLCHMIRIYIFLSLLIPYNYGLKDECLGLDLCTGIAKILISNITDINAINHVDKQHERIIEECRRYFKCENDRSENFFTNHAIEPRSLSYSSIFNIVRKKAIRKPKDWYKSPYCQKCERKRSKCTTYYIFTYGICTGAYLISGSFTSYGCNLITLPRTVDCVLNTFLNCYLKDCGLIGF